MGGQLLLKAPQTPRSSFLDSGHQKADLWNRVSTQLILACGLHFPLVLSLRVASSNMKWLRGKGVL